MWSVNLQMQVVIFGLLSLKEACVVRRTCTTWNKVLEQVVHRMYCCSACSTELFHPRYAPLHTRTALQASVSLFLLLLLLVVMCEFEFTNANPSACPYTEQDTHACTLARRHPPMLYSSTWKKVLQDMYCTRDVLDSSLIEKQYSHH